MADLRSIVSHLQIIHIWASFALEQDINFFNEAHMRNIAEWTNDALELLKDKTTAVDMGNDIPAMFCCHKCHSAVAYKQPFCHYCGRLIKWDDLPG